MALTCIISEKKRDIWSKIAIFLYPIAFDGPVRGVRPRRIIAILFGTENYSSGAN